MAVKGYGAALRRQHGPGESAGGPQEVAVGGAVIAMLTANWWTNGHLAEARCAKDGMALVTATGDPLMVRQLALPVTTAFLTPQHSTYQGANTWGASAQTKDKWRMFQERERAKAQDDIPRKRFTPGPRHGEDRPIRYIPLGELQTSEQREGVVAKVEHAGAPMYEIQLPVRVRCVRCSERNTVEALLDSPPSAMA